MKKMRNFGIPMPTVNLALNRSRIKMYNKSNSIPTYYLKKGEEFQIELYNPTQGNILAKIKLNNKSISSGGLILRPGERVFLDRFIESNHKLLFDTYEVSKSKASKKAIEVNGDIKVEFFNEYIAPSYTTNITLCGNTNTTNWPYGYQHIPDSNFTTTSLGDMGNVTNTSTYNIRSAVAGSIETGRVEKGDTSDQKLVEGYGTYETASFHSIEYKLLPISQKKVETKELHRLYCTECGTKNKSTYKFCPTCGTKV